jgi:hypothetical protein
MAAAPGADATSCGKWVAHSQLPFEKIAPKINTTLHTKYMPLLPMILFC